MLTLVRHSRITSVHSLFNILESSSPDAASSEPLLFFYDCETTGESHVVDHIIEITTMVLVPDGVHITNLEFSSLCHTSRLINAQGV